MSNVVLQLVWVAAHHGLRKMQKSERAHLLWSYVHDITEVLGFPPAPMGRS